MPYIVIWTDGALEDLARYHAFMAEEDAGLGLKAVEAIEEGTLLLERFPNAGRPAVDLEPEQKELLVSFGSSGYVLLYEVEGEKVFILAIRHQREAGY